MKYISYILESSVVAPLSAFAIYSLNDLDQSNFTEASYNNTLHTAAKEGKVKKISNNLFRSKC